MRYVIDIDETICVPGKTEEERYTGATPIKTRIDIVNRLYDEGNHIIIMTARGRGSGIDWTEWTTKQLDMWGVKYHDLEPMFHKPTADLFIDDKGISVEEWKKTVPPKKGIIAGAFDVIHPGYIRMFKDAKAHCNHLTIALHEDPSMARPHKLKPVQTVEERKEILHAIKYVDDVVVYQAEETFLSYLKDYEIRFLGTDYIDGSYTGKDIAIDIIWLNRDHDYSSTKLKTEITKQVRNAMFMGVNYD